ncbi:MAG TPA: hypothetical protein VJR27_00815 [Candidatus Saccharimonadales bacterium]|nr:hypothetical protein [Candidatus Saccharimonadales bacterium]
MSSDDERALPEPSLAQWQQQAEQVRRLAQLFEPIFTALHVASEQAEQVIAADSELFGELAVVEGEDLVGLLKQANRCVRGAERVVVGYEGQLRTGTC